MSNCLITGLSGFVASHLADYLIEHTDWEIYGTVRKRSPTDNIEHLADLINRGERVHLVYADLGDSGSLAAAIAEAKPDFVFHLAAQSDPQYSFRAVAHTLDVNATGTARLLQLLPKNTRTLVCSSSEVYGQTPPELTPIKEDCPFHPASPYAVSKIATDMIAQYYMEAESRPIVITRMFTHTGPRRGDYFMESSFAKQIAMIEAGQLEPVVKHGNLQSVRTIADVRDTVRGYAMLIQSPHIGVFNAGGNTTARVGDILNTLLLMSEKSIKTELDPARLRPIDADNQIPDISKFKKAFPTWTPAFSYQDTMRDLLNYWRDRVKRRGSLQR